MLKYGQAMRSLDERLWSLAEPDRDGLEIAWVQNPAEKTLTSQHFMDHDPHREDVRTLVDGKALQLLGRHVGHGPGPTPGPTGTEPTAGTPNPTVTSTPTTSPAPGTSPTPEGHHAFLPLLARY